MLLNVVADAKVTRRDVGDNGPLNPPEGGLKERSICENNFKTIKKTATPL